MAVAHDAGVAESSFLMAGSGVAVARHHGRLHDFIPSLAIVAAAADVEVDASASDVDAAVAIVGHSNQRSVISRSNGGNTVGDIARGECLEDFHLRFDGNAGLADGHEEVRDVDTRIGA